MFTRVEGCATTFSFHLSSILNVDFLVWGWKY